MSETADTRAQHELTRDAFLDERLVLTQPAKGHRAGSDAALLSAAIAPSTAGMVVDMGAGVGSVGLSVALLCPLASIRLVEIDPEIAAIARENIGANQLSQRVTIVVADVAAAERQKIVDGLDEGMAETVVANPPFLIAGRARSSPNAYRRLAHQSADGALEAWIRSAAWLLKPRGVFVMIHRADALAAILPLFASRFGDIRVKPVHPKPASAATRVLIRGIKGSRAPLALLPPLILHVDSGRFTEEAEALHRGSRTIDWLV